MEARQGQKDKLSFYTSSQRQLQLRWQPGLPARFSSVRDPPWASAIWRLSARPIPDPPRLGGENGTNKFVVPASPGPSSSIRISTFFRIFSPADLHAAAGFERGVSGVAQQVDQQLVS